MEIKLKNIRKSFGGAQVIYDMSLTFSHGCFTTLLGPSGCGKTTLLRIIAGLETPDSGEIWFDEACVFSADRRINVPPEKRNLGFVFQDFALWPHMTVFENVAFGLRARKQTKDLKPRVTEALETVKLANFVNRYPHQLSGGQQQRVAFARAIVIEPKCILFDEPLSALDAILREEMRAEIRNLISELRVTAVFVTHDQTEAMSMSDTIFVLRNGQIEQQGKPEEIYRHPATPFVARFVGRSNWIGERMFRPENLYFSPLENSEEYITKVKSSRFIGSGYEVSIERDDESWSAISPNCVTNGEISVYVKADDILSFSNK